MIVGSGVCDDAFEALPCEVDLPAVQVVRCRHLLISHGFGDRDCCNVEIVSACLPRPTFANILILNSSAIMSVDSSWLMSLDNGGGRSVGSVFTRVQAFYAKPRAWLVAEDQCLFRKNSPLEGSINLESNRCRSSSPKS
jgi:hypothetical protein